jgi:alanine dehydrogenase
MKIGIIKEMKPFEHRVMLNPQAVKELVDSGHEVILENDAGDESGFSDKEYEGMGAAIVPTPEKVFELSSFILKIQPPMPIEFELIKKEHLIMSLVFPINNQERLSALQKANAIFLAGELLNPIYQVMDEITGKVAVNQALKYLERDFGSKGILFSGTCGVPGANVCILGDGPSAIAAANQSIAYGAKVSLVGEEYKKLLTFKSNHPSDQLNVYEYDRGFLNTLLIDTDVLIATTQPHGKNANMKIRNEDIKVLSPGTLVVDLSIHHGDLIESSRKTIQDDPIYMRDGILFYAVADLPAAVPRTSSEILSNSITSYIKQLADMGFEEAVAINPEIRESLYLYHGKIVNQILADEDGHQKYDVLELIESNV